MSYQDRLKERIKEAEDTYHGFELLSVYFNDQVDKHERQKQSLYLFGKLRGLEMAQELLLEEQNGLQE